MSPWAWSQILALLRVFSITWHRVSLLILKLSAQIFSLRCCNIYGSSKYTLSPEPSDLVILAHFSKSSDLGNDDSCGSCQTYFLSMATIICHLSWIYCPEGMVLGELTGANVCDGITWWVTKKTFLPLQRLEVLCPNS